MQAKDIMRREVIAVRETDSVAQLVELFVREHIHGAPVLDENDGLVGVVTQQDIFFSTMTLGVTEDAASPTVSGVNSLSVADIMTRPAVSANEETDIGSLCRIMTRLRIHRIPIVSRGRVSGMVSSLDVCRAVGERGLA